MTAEEIIERLLDERKITAKEAIVLLKAIINVVTDDWIGRFKKLIDESNKKAEEERKKNSKPNDVPWAPAPQKQNPWIGPDIVVCYGVQIPDYTLAINDSIQTYTGDYAHLEQYVANGHDSAVICNNECEITTAHANSYSSSDSTYVFNPDGSCDASIKVNN